MTPRSARRGRKKSRGRIAGRSFTRQGPGSASLIAAQILLVPILIVALLGAALVLGLLLAALAAELALLAGPILAGLLLAGLAARRLAARGALVVFGAGKFPGILLGAVDPVLLILVVVELAESRLVAEFAALVRLALILVELAHLDILHLEAADGTTPPLAWER